jgi:predicted metalloprotease with PDZ domain
VLNRVIRFVISALVSVSAYCQTSTGPLAFTVSADRPGAHYYHVEFRCDGLRGDPQDFKMPVWMPGFYRVQDYPKDVINFKVVDGEGHPLSWVKTNKNTWRVKTANSSQVVVSYDVYAFTRSAGGNYLDDRRGFFVGPGVYLHVAGLIGHPVTVTIKTPADWSSVANGLDPVPGRPNTFSAPDFDVLYDCPMLLGNQEHFQFEVRGVPHYVVAEDVPAGIDRNKIAGDLKKIVTAATDMMGEIPYKHYTFLLMGRGGGGVEHLTSTAMMFDGNSLDKPDGYRRWLSFAAHEYFHTFNVKRIRPIALGPFDYDRENFTAMLWESEGFTSYYMDLLVERAGLMSHEQYFDALTHDISNYENIPGHLFQSAAESSIDAWIHGEDAANTTISYYDKGSAIAALLDFKIRAATKNGKSLDDVMRAAYQEFFKEKGRGFTDQEFRELCERVAGEPLPEIFDLYIASTKEVDYPKYFALAGLKIDAELRAKSGVVYLGAVVEGAGRGGRGPVAPAGKLIIARVEYDSPASRAGLSAQDEILAVDGETPGSRSLDDLLKAKIPGDHIKILIARDGRVKEIEVVLGLKMERSFKIQPVESPTALQAAILKDWLKKDWLK